MTGQRIALIVAIDQYQHPGLRELVAPAADAEALAGVLADRERGGFDVEVLHNVAASAISERLEDLLTERQPSDLVLVHFSCHGLKDDAGELYLAATNTVPSRLATTAVDTVLVNRLMRRSRARRVVLLLDCCYGGAFERGVIARAGGDVDVGHQFTMDPLGGGRGRAIITASSAMEYAFEGARLAEDAAAQPSLFTAALVEGLATGDADRDNDGHVALGELYDYVYDRVRERSPHQTPCKWEFGIQGELYLARNPHRRIVPGRLPPELAELTEHHHADVRLTAVQLLERAARENDLPRAAAARRALTELADDDSRRVSTAASTALQQTGLRLSVPSLDLGQVAVGGTAQSSPVALEGPPLALESLTLTVTGPLDARLDRAAVSIIWTPKEPGSLDAAVTVSGPAGGARLAVTGRAVAPAAPSQPPEEQPPQGKPAVESPHASGSRSSSTSWRASSMWNSSRPTPSTARPVGGARLAVTGRAVAPAAPSQPPEEQPPQGKPAVESPHASGSRSSSTSWRASSMWSSSRPTPSTRDTDAETPMHVKLPDDTPSATGRSEAVAERAPSQTLWWLILLRGGLAVIFGLYVLIGPGRTLFDPLNDQVTHLLALVLGYGFYAITDGVAALVVGVRHRSTSYGGWHIVDGLVSLIAGLIAVVYTLVDDQLALFFTEPTVLMLMLIIGAWSILLGGTKIAEALTAGRRGSSSWGWLLAGGIVAILMGIVLGIVLGTSNTASLADLAVGMSIIGWFALVFGVMYIVWAFRLRSA